MDGKVSATSSIKIEVQFIRTCDCRERQALRLYSSVSSNGHSIRNSTVQLSRSNHREHEIMETRVSSISSDSCDDATSLLISTYLDDLTHILFVAIISKPTVSTQG